MGILFIKIQVIFINFPILYFLMKKAVKFPRTQPTAYRFNSQINVRVNATYNSGRLEQYTNSSFPHVNWWKFSPAQIASCRNVNQVVDSCHLPKLFLLTQEKLSKLIDLGRKTERLWNLSIGRTAQTFLGLKRIWNTLIHLNCPFLRELKYSLTKVYAPITGAFGINVRSLELIKNCISFIP